MLRKRVAVAPRPPVTSVPTAIARHSRHGAGPPGPFCPSGPSFPRGLCYLVGVAPGDRAAAMLTLGSYPLVQSLLSSWLFQPAGIYLVSRSPGLYHTVTSDVVGSVPVCLGLPGWKVGADENFPPLPRSTDRPRPSDNRFFLPDSRPRLPDARPRLSGARPPPRYFEDGGLDPSNRGGGTFRGGGDRGLPSFGPYSRGAGRGRGRTRAPSPAPFRPQYFDGDQRGRGRGAARRDVPHETWKDANQSPFDIAIANMKKSLEDLPRYIAVDSWNDFLSWLKDYQRASGVEKNASVPFIEAHFNIVLAAAN